MGKLKEKLQLSSAEVAKLESLLSKGKHSVRKVKRAQILLRLHEGKTHRGSRNRKSMSGFCI